MDPMSCTASLDHPLECAPYRMMRACAPSRSQYPCDAAWRPCPYPRPAFHGLMRAIFYGDWPTAHGGHASTTSDRRISADWQRGDDVPSGRVRYYRVYTHRVSGPAEGPPARLSFVRAVVFTPTQTAPFLSAFWYAKYPYAR